MTNKNKFANAWSSVERLSPAVKKKLLKTNVEFVVEFMMEKMMTNRKMDIGVFTYGRQTGSVVSYREAAKELTLRLKASSYEMVLTLINKESELHSFSYNLSEKEIKFIPDKLKTAMNRVKQLSKPLSLQKIF